MVTRRNLVLGAGAVGLVGAGAYFSMQGPSYDEAVQARWAAMAPGGDADLEYLVHYATLAANSHNTQPWLFRRSGEGVVIQPDFSRATHVVDSDDHHLFASLGCASENLMLAAAAEGKSAAVHVGDDGEVQIDLAAGAAGSDPLFDAIVERQCTRSVYDGRGLVAADLNALQRAAEAYGGEVIFVTETAQTEKVLELILAGNTEQVDDPAFREELKSWLRFNSGAAVETGDGLYAPCTGNPTLPSWLGPMMFGMVFSAQSENDKVAKQVRSSSALAIFVSGGDDRAHWIQSGRSYQRFALQATALGMKHAFLNQTVEVPGQRAELAALLGLGDKRPDLVVRFGYGPSMPRSLRRPVSDVIVGA